MGGGCSTQRSSKVFPANREHCEMAATANINMNGNGSDVVKKEREEQCDRFGFVFGSQEASAEQTAKAHRQTIAKERERELKWMKMLQNWSLYTSTKREKLQRRCYKGIPDSVRGLAWEKLVAADQDAGLTMQEFEFVSSLVPEPKSELESFFDVIDKDLHRTFPSHEMFISRDGGGQKDLCYILRAFAYTHPDPGYCQGMGFIAAVLLMNQRMEVAYKCFCKLLRKVGLHTFALLRHILVQEKYMLGTFSHGLSRMKAYTGALDLLIKRKLPHLSRHLEKHSMEGLLFAVDWFMCNFGKVIHFSSRFCMIHEDIVLGFGIAHLGYVHVIIKTAFEIMNLMKNRLLSCEDMQALMMVLRDLPRDVVNMNTLIPAVLKSKLQDHEIHNALKDAEYQPQEDIEDTPVPIVIQHKAAPVDVDNQHQHHLVSVDVDTEQVTDVFIDQEQTQEQEAFVTDTTSEDWV